MTVKNQTLRQSTFPPSDHATIQHRRDFTATTDATSLILKYLDFPSNRRRNIVCALQGVGNGRDRFECSHINLARRMQHKGSDAAAQQAVYRELKALEDFQHRAGYQLFKITRGGGSEHRRTG